MTIAVFAGCVGAEADGTASSESEVEAVGVEAAFATTFTARVVSSNQVDLACLGKDDKIYVTGGHQVWKGFDIYNPSTRSWTRGPDVPPPHKAAYYGGGMVTGVDGRVYFIGGGLRGNYPREVDVYDPRRNRWVGY